MLIMPIKSNQSKLQCKMSRHMTLMNSFLGVKFDVDMFCFDRIVSMTACLL